MRVFIAADVPGRLREALVETQAELRATVRGRYVAPDQLHVTLAFLGDVSAHEVDLASEALRSVVLDVPPVEVSLGTLGAFGPRRTSTLWQAVESEDLELLAARVRGSLDKMGIRFDAKAFRGHVTLMRGADLSGGMLPSASCDEGVVRTVSLYRSHLGADGATYEVLEHFTLGGDRYRTQHSSR